MARHKITCDGITGNGKCSCGIVARRQAEESGYTIVGEIPETVWNGEITIVKVQMPVSTNMPEPLALIYDKTRAWEIYVPLDHVQEIMGNEVKTFFYANFMSTHKLHFGEKKPEWQDW